jgi:hypothetical protein
MYLMNILISRYLGLAFLCQLVASTAVATDVIDAKLMTLDLARDIAGGAIDACRKDGYRLSCVMCLQVIT